MLHFIARSHSSFNIIDDPTFHVSEAPPPFETVYQLQTLFHSTKSSESLKGRRHYSDNVLPKVYDYDSQRIRSLLNDIQWVSFTCDVWSGPTARFMG